MFAAVAVDADRGNEHQVIAHMQPVDLDDQEVEIGQIGAHERVQLFRRQGNEAP